MSYGSPLEVGRPWNLRPYHDASPRSVSTASPASGVYQRPKISYGLLGPPLRSGSMRGSASGTCARFGGGFAPAPSRPEAGRRGGVLLQASSVSALSTITAHDDAGRSSGCMGVTIHQQVCASAAWLALPCARSHSNT